MIRSKGRRRLTCHHEAGHAVARWFFGFHVDSVEVLSVDQVRSGVTVEDRRGREVVCEGLCNGYDIHFALPPDLCGFPLGEDRDQYASQGRVRAGIALVALMAGIAAEARYRKCSTLSCLLAGGGGDYSQACTIAGDWLPDAVDPIGVATARAAQLFSCPQAWTAVRALAERLWIHGAVSGEQVAEICREAFGGREPRYGAWDEHWPPIDRQLRCGHMPASTQELAA